MKWIKLFESWSEPYTIDFKDKGFELEEVGQRLKGRYRGKFLMSDINTWYAELVDRLNYEWEVTHSKSSFNSPTGNASFEIEIIDRGSNSFVVKKDGVDVKLYPLSVHSFNSYGRDGLQKVDIFIECKTDNGSRVSFGMRTETTSDSDIIILNYYLGNKTIGVDVSDDQLEIFIDSLGGLKWSEAHYNRELDEAEKNRLNLVINGSESRPVYLKSIIGSEKVWNRAKSHYQVKK